VAAEGVAAEGVAAEKVAAEEMAAEEMAAEEMAAEEMAAEEMAAERRSTWTMAVSPETPPARLGPWRRGAEIELGAGHPLGAAPGGSPPRARPLDLDSGQSHRRGR
jgi:hypothetical protein